MIEMHHLKNVVIFIQTILSFVPSRKFTNQEVQYKRKNMLKVNNQTLKELKDAIELIKENATEMRKTIKENHQEVMIKIEQVERKTEIAFELAKKNEIEINSISKDYNEFKKECNPNHLNSLTE